MSAHYKLVLVGDSGVGKTAYLNSLLGSHFEPRYLATRGIEIRPLELEVDGQRVHFDVWDLSGQEKFGAPRARAYADADLAIVMFDVRNVRSLKNAGLWLGDIRDFAPGIPVFLVGNKTDLPDWTTGFNQDFGGFSSVHLVSAKRRSQCRDPLREFVEGFVPPPKL